MDTIKSAGVKAKNMAGNLFNTATAPIQNAANAVSNAANNAFSTKSAIAGNGLLFKDPKSGQFIGIAGVDPNSPQGQDVTRQYISQGYEVANEEDRRVAASTNNMVVHNGAEVQGNLKDATIKVMKDLKNTAQNFEAQATKLPVVTSQDAGGMYKQFNNKLLAGAREAQAIAGKQQPHPQVQPQQQAPANQAQQPVKPNVPQAGNTVVSNPGAPANQQAPAHIQAGLGTQQGINGQGGPQTARVYAGQLPTEQQAAQPVAPNINAPVTPLVNNPTDYEKWVASQRPAGLGNQTVQ
jgi:hypothetical protein